MKTWRFFFITIVALGGASVTSTPKAAAGTLLYTAFKKEFLKVDSFMEAKLKLHVNSCRYTSYVTHKVSTFGSFGECLSLNISESFSTPNDAGAMDLALTSLTTNENLGFQVIWRPEVTERLHTLNLLYKDWRKKQDPDGLFGNLTINFPAGPLDEGTKLLNSFGSVGRAFVRRGIHLSQIYVAVQPEAPDDWDQQYLDADVSLYETGNAEPFYKIHARSDFDLFNRQKQFYLEVEGQ